MRAGTPGCCVPKPLPLLEETSRSGGSGNEGQMSSHPSRRSVMCAQASLEVEADASVSLAFLLSVSFGHSLF